MGGKSRKTGTISQKLIDRVKASTGGRAPNSKPKPAKDSFGILDEEAGE